MDKDLSTFGAERPDNLRLVEADVTDPAFEPGEFDLVHARFLLCHLPSRDEVLARVVRWLAPGGWLVLTAQGLTELGHAGYLGSLGNGQRDRWRPLIDPVVPELLAAR